MRMTKPRYRYVVGDIQGCHAEFSALLELIEFDPAQDQLWIAGDLINRGPASLEVLRYVRSLGESAISVLGNHDFFFLAVAAGAVQPGPEDTLAELLAAPDRDSLVDWLRKRPLMHVGDGFAMVHAGLLPEWTIGRARTLAAEVERALQGEKWREFLRGLWGGKPRRWSDELAGPDRLRIIVNTFCRTRFLNPDGSLDLKPKGRPEDTPNHIPWYAFPDAAWRTHTVLQGHWSALGFRDMGHVIALDSGCVWGGALSAIRLEDRRLWQVAAAANAGEAD
jgi:bis(5'-nucleosyl)-tetraphosphatase (symmetrical)